MKSKSIENSNIYYNQSSNIIRETRLGALDSTVAGSDEKRLPILGEPDHQFSFNELRNRIEFVDCCASKEFKNLENIMKSINSV